MIGVAVFLGLVTLIGIGAGVARLLYESRQRRLLTDEAAELALLDRMISLSECGSCGGDLGRSDSYPWHYADEDCRAIRPPVLAWPSETGRPEN